MRDHSQKIKSLKQLISKNPRVEQCQTHLLPKEQICLFSNCKQYLILNCSDCIRHHTHKSMNIKKIAPVLTKWLGQIWEQIRVENSEIQRQWNICEVNINYCFDILKEVKKMISNRTLHDLPIFDQLIQITTQISKGQLTTDGILDRVDILNKKFGIFPGDKLDPDCIIKQREFRKGKWAKMGEKTKQFSQKALAFSETLARTIQDKLQYEKRIKKLQVLSKQRIFSLNDLLKNPSNSNLEQISNLKIQMNNPKEQQQNVQQILEKCENLKSLYINNRNGKIVHRNWKLITQKLEYLNRLKELKLNIRMQDLLVLTKLFKQHPNSVRYIEILHLTISDEPKLDMVAVSEFCNTLQLRQLNLTLTRDNIGLLNFREFLKVVRVQTSLSQLPMKVFNLNISKNKFKQEQKSQCEFIFNDKCKHIKTKSILI